MSGDDELGRPGSLRRREVLAGLAGTGALAGGLGQVSRGDEDEQPERYVVGIDPAARGAIGAQSAARSRAVAVHREVNLGSVRRVVAGWYTRERRAALRDHPAVAYVEPDHLLEPLGPAGESQTGNGDATYPWGIERIGARAVHEEGYTGEGADVVVIDTGTTPSYPALETGGGEAFGTAGCTEATRRFETVTCNRRWDDDHYHGSHVAGVAGASDVEVPGSDSGEVDRLAGVAPDATLHAANVFEWTQQGGEWVPLAPSSNTADAIRWAADQGYDVANVSLGGPSPSTAIADALTYATDQHDLVVVAAAGNDGTACDEDPFNDDPDDCVSYPAAFDAAIAVGNTTRSDEVAASSSRGPEVDVAAPGTDVLSSVPAHVPRESPDVDRPYDRLTGTSMAAPHVAGLAALLRAHPELSGDEIRQRLRETATDISTRDVETGAGLVDASAALDTESASLAVETGEATGVRPTSAVVTGELTGLGDRESVSVSVEYGPAAAPDEARLSPAHHRTETGPFEVELTGLRQDTAYTFRAIAESGEPLAAGDEAAFRTLVEPVSHPTVDTTGAGDATVSQWGEGYRIRAAGLSPLQRPRNEHGYGAIYGWIGGDVVVETTLVGLRGEHDLRMAGLAVSNDVEAGGGVAGDLLLAVEPAAGVSLLAYDDDAWEYETVASASASLTEPVDLRLIRRGEEVLAEYRAAGGSTEDDGWQTVGSHAVPDAADAQQAGVFATGGHATDRCVADFGAFRLSETTVTLTPPARTVEPDTETTFDLVVENATDGIESYAATVEVSDPAALRIEGVDPAGEVTASTVEVAADGSRASIEAEPSAGARASSDVTVATLTVHASEVATVDVTLPRVSLTDETGLGYEVGTVEGAAVTITEDVGPPPVVGEDPPRDLDGDGLYRDIDGDGELTAHDVRALLRHRRDDGVLDNAHYFNFSEGDHTTVSLADVQALLSAVLDEEPGTGASLDPGDDGGSDPTDGDGDEG